MKINIVFLLPYNNQGIGGTDRKFGIYYNNLNIKYFNKYCIYVTDDMSKVKKNGNDIVLTNSQVLLFLEEKHIQFVYYGWAKVEKNIYAEIIRKYYVINNINFANLYQKNDHLINFIISKTLYLKLQGIHGDLTNSYVTYNPIFLDNWIKLKQGLSENYRSKVLYKKYIIGRIARSEPSKRDFSILNTIWKLKKDKNYNYGFIFAGMPLLHRLFIRFLLNKRELQYILFLPELKELKDIAKFYDSIDVFWQSSSAGETFGNVIAEAFCFGKPVITDFRDFYAERFDRNDEISCKKIYKNVDNAQIELVDCGINGRYGKYPQAIIDFLENHSKQELVKLGQNGYKKVKELYDVNLASDTMAKILYNFGKQKGFYKKNNLFEDLRQIPSENEIKNYKKIYLKKIEQCYKINTIKQKEKIKYYMNECIWRCIEYIYLVIRKILKNYFNMNIEKF